MAKKRRKTATSINIKSIDVFQTIVNDFAEVAKAEATEAAEVEAAGAAFITARERYLAARRWA